MSKVPVAFAYPDEPAHRSHIFTELAFLQHTQLSQPFVVATRGVHLVAIQPQDRVSRVLQIARLPQVCQLWPLVGAGSTITIQLHQREHRHAQLARHILQPSRRSCSLRMLVITDTRRTARSTSVSSMLTN